MTRPALSTLNWSQEILRCAQDDEEGVPNTGKADS